MFFSRKEVRMNRWWLAAVAPTLAVLVLGPPVSAAENKSPVKTPDASAGVAPAEKGEAGKKAIEPAEFPMTEVPAFGKEEVDGKTRYNYPSGAFTMCSPAPNKEVKAYPELKSKRPLYGAVMFDAGSSNVKARKVFCFVLDESGEKKPEAAEKKTDEAEKKTGEVEKKAKILRRRAPEMKYDLLYFDRNGDLDLTNDGVVKLAQKPPFEGLPEGAQAGYFESLKVTLDYGPPAGEQPFTLVPHALAYGGDNVLLQFVPATARKGRIRLGGEEYAARLTQSQSLTGRYDRPQVQLELAPVGDKAHPVAPGPLALMRNVGGQFVSFSASPTGDKLTVEPYRGEIGLLEVGSGGRAITELGIAGQLTSRTGVMIALSGTLSQGQEVMPRSYSLPVGDYTLPYFTARHGRLQFSGRMTANVSPPSGESSPFPIEIRKDKPFVVQFSGKPEVKFMSPPKERSFKPGENIYVAAMLTEPHEGIQITGLWDTSDKDGKPARRQLDPTIAIRNAAGDVVSEGKMPFG
jgi:hypothetical protein